VALCAGLAAGALRPPLGAKTFRKRPALDSDLTA
jgi:hypothetical protein